VAAEGIGLPARSVKIRLGDSRDVFDPLLPGSRYGVMMDDSSASPRGVCPRAEVTLFPRGLR
jgi:hypothetical protein